MFAGVAGGCLAAETDSSRCTAFGGCGPWNGGAGADEGGSVGTDEDEPDDSDEPGSDTAGDTTDHGLPCDVREALALNCGECHGAEPAFGAPMPLTDYDDLRVPANSDPTRPVYEVVAERMTADVGMMPPDGDIDDGDAAVILDWIAEGAKRDESGSCGDAPPDAPDVDVGPEHLPCEVTHEMKAHAHGNLQQPYAVPQQGADNLYQCFVFRSPFAAGEQATAWAPIIDDQRVVHHWILYRADSGNYQDGSVIPCDVGLQISTEFVAGWAPGGENVILPPDVGLELGTPDDWYLLQIHYNNTANYADAFDASGVAFCSTPSPRQNTAGVLTLGTTSLAIPPGAVGHEEKGTCGFLSTISWPGPMHLVASSPHMHKLGRGFRTVLDRFAGGTEMVTDIPVFDYESQGFYLHDAPITVNPGDTLRSTCVFDNPSEETVLFGEGTNDEMCFNFVLAYPIDQLSNRNCGIIF